MNQQQRETLKILGIAFITGIILTICLHLTEGAAQGPEFLL